MLNNTQRLSVHNNLKFNSISGTLVKSHPDSWFERYHLNSKFSDKRLKEESYVITLQTMVVGEMEVISEVVKREDYLSVAADKEDSE